jgi:undecaprenyl diphosphate synthase
MSTGACAGALAARHVAIVADGNRRWARSRGLSLAAGYEAGADILRARIDDAIELGVKELAVHSFSTENWARPVADVHSLLSTLATRLASETPALHRDGIRMRFIGARRDAPTPLCDLMDWSEQFTAQNQRLSLYIAFSYGGRSEILHAAERFQGGTENDFRRHLYAPEMHDPDLIIRTGGEQRLSNYLLWQAAYAELAFRQELWPDFTRAALEQALEEFKARRRRCRGR